MPFHARLNPSADSISQIAAPLKRSKSERRRARAIAAAIEPLESRILLTAISWTGGTGDWSNASDWSGGVVPGYYDTVTIPSGANVTISSGQTANSLTAAPGSTLTIANGATFNIITTGTIGGAFELDGLLGDATSITLSGTTVVKGTIEVTTTTNAGPLTFNGGGLNGGASFINNATVTVTGGMVITGGSGTTFTNTPSGTVNVTDDTGFLDSGGYGGSFINEGTLDQTGGTGTDVFEVGAGYGGNFENNGGIINIQSGNFQVNSPVQLDGGQINVATGSIFSLDNGTPASPQNVYLAGTLTGSGGGHIDFNSGNFNPETENETIATATLNFPTGYLNIGQVTLNAIGGPPTFIVNSGDLTFDSTTGYGSVSLDNTGTVEVTGTSDIAIGAAEFVNEASGVVDLETDAGFSGPDANFTQLTNDGTIEKTGGSGTSIIGVTFFNSGGTLNVGVGTLSFQYSAALNAGPISVATGADLDFNTANHIYLQGIFTSTGGGIVTLSSGFMAGPSGFYTQDTSQNATLNFGPNTLYINNDSYLDDSGNITSDALINTGYIYEDGNGRGLNYTSQVGDFTNSGTVYLNGQIEWEKGATLLNTASGVVDFNGPTSIFLDVIDRLNNQGTILLDPGAGNTLDFASPFIADFVNNNVPSLMNTGTIEAVSGTIKYPAISMGTAGSGTFTGGTLKIDAGAKLKSDTSFPIMTNDGTIILGGAGATFKNANSLAVNNGTFKVLSGTTFSTMSSLANSGTLAVGGTVTINGDLDEASASSALKFLVAAAAGSTGAPILTVSGNTTLAGTLSASFSNGFAVAAGTPYTVANFANPATGSFSSTAGVGPAFTANVGSTNIVLDSTAAGGADLDVSNVTGPSTFSPGQTATIGYTVTNIAATMASGPWTDSIFLAPHGTIGRNDILLASVTHSGNLTQNQSYNGSTPVTFPAVGGSYVILVETDSGLAVPDVNRANNVAVSGSVVPTYPTLPLNGSATGTISGNQTLVYQLAVPGGADVNIAEMMGANQATDLEVSRGAIPTPSTAQYYDQPQNSTTLQVLLPGPTPGTYYVSITGQPGIPDGTSFSLTTATATYGLYSVSPAALGQGQVTLNLTGSGFTAGTVVQLLNGSTVVATAISSTAIDANNISANFDLTNVPVGTYSVSAVTGSHTATLSSAVTVQAANIANAVTYTLSLPTALRIARTYQLTVTYTNTSNLDVPAPLFSVAQSLYEPALTFELAGGNPGSDLATTGVATPDSINLMALNQSGDAGVLPPGYTGQYEIDFTTPPTFPAHQPFDLYAEGVSTSTVNLSAFQQYSAYSPLTWAILAAEMDGLTSLKTDPIANSTTLTGYAVDFPSGSNVPVPTDLTVPYTGYQQLLDNVASALSQGGEYQPDALMLFNNAIEGADQFGQVTQRTVGGSALIHRPEPFGAGGIDPYYYAIENNTDDGTLDFVSPDGTESFDTYTLLPTAPSNTDTLTHLPNGTYQVTTLLGGIYQFDNSGVIAYSQSAGGVRTTYNYGVSGQLTSIDFANGDAVSFTYNSTYNVIASATDALTGNTTTYGYQIVTTGIPGADANVPLLTTITTPAGTTTITYTSTSQLHDDQVSTRIAIDSGGYNPFGPDYSITNYYYYTHSPATAYLPASITLPDGSGQHFSYDAFGRLIQSSLLDGSALTTYSYDSTGLIQTATQDGNSTTVITDGGDDQIKVVAPSGDSFVNLYNAQGLLTSIVDPSGSQTSIAYDSTGDTTSVTNEDGSTKTYTYNALHELATVTDGNGNVTGLGYDSDGDITSINNPDHTSSTYQYNSLDELTQSTSADGIVDNIGLNSMGLPTSESFSNGTDYSYTYDAKGDLLTATGPSGTTTYTYDSAQRVTSVTSPGGHTISYVYNSADEIASIANGPTTISTYTYDADGRLVTVDDGSGALVVQYAYDDQSQLSMKTFGNGTKTVYAYDANGRIASITNLSATSTVTSSETYAYDASGNPISVTDASGNVTNYTYDPAGQLTQVALPGGRTITYHYDADGNRTSVVDSGVTTTYTSNSLNEYTTVGSTTYTYDADGNLTSQTDNSGTTTYTYNGSNQLVGSIGPSGTFTYTYNALGQLSSFKDNGVKTTLVRDPSGDVIATYDASGNLIDNYQIGLGLVGEVPGSGSALYYQSDLTGNVTALTNSSGAVANSYSYLPFGEKISSTGSAGNLFTYSGANGVLDLGDGLFQTQKRTYSPVLGRFIEPDPVFTVNQSDNDFEYAYNDPTLFVDPAGADPATVLLTTVGVAAPSSPNLPAVYQGPVPSSPNLPAVYDGPPPSAIQEAEQGAARGLAKLAAESAPEDAAVVGGTSVATVAAVGTGGTVIIYGTYKAATYDLYLKYQYADDLIAQGDKSINQDRYNPKNIKNKLILQLIEEHVRITGQYPTSASIDAWVHGLATGYLAGDPNDIVGPNGYGAAGFINTGQTLPYLIHFQNETTASAAAQDVVVTQQLSSNLDWSTFQLTAFGFGSHSVTIPAGLMTYSKLVNDVAAEGVDVEVSASFDPSTGQLTWSFTSIDPRTQTPASGIAADTLLGFLPPDDTAGDGEGFISYTVLPKSSDPTGATITAQGTVVFDQNAPINTPLLTNTVDSVAPTSSVDALPATMTTTNAFNLSWSGQDDAGGSGIATYDVYVSENGGTYIPLLINTTSTSTTFTGAPGDSYSFYSIATDNAGNIQATPGTAEATTTIASDTATLESDGSLWILGSASNDTIVVSESSGNIDVTINGNAQTPVPASSVTAIVLDAGEGNDTVTIDAGVPATVVRGGAGDDTLIAMNTGDTLNGGVGDDSISATSGANLLKGQSGNDSLSGGSGADTLLGGGGNDSLLGGTGNQSLAGGAGDDTLQGGSRGNDTMAGGAGKDWLFAGPGNNVLKGGKGADILGASTGDDTLSGNKGADSIVGGPGNDSLNGGPGLDTLTGSNDPAADTGIDTISGGGQNDSITGTNANDVILEN